MLRIHRFIAGAQKGLRGELENVIGAVAEHDLVALGQVEERGKAVADPAHDAAYVWVIVRHEIDYLRPAFEGDVLTATTWVGEAPKGARFDRHMEFVGDDGKVRVRAVTQWAIIDKAAGRPIRVPAEVVAPFMEPR